MTYYSSQRGDGLANTRNAIRDHDAFKSSGALSGGERGYFGVLPKEYRDAFFTDNPTYVVYSYATPIAWIGDRGWVVPSVKYSATTSRHQSVVRSALSEYMEN